MPETYSRRALFSLPTSTLATLGVTFPLAQGRNTKCSRFAFNSMDNPLSLEVPPTLVS